MKLLVLNGPNINMLGIREPQIYGHKTYADLCVFISKTAQSEGITVEMRQSNHEGVMVDMIQQALTGFDGIIINPAAFTHTSVAILDALKAVNLPTVEVHLTDPDQREDFRKISYVRAACIQTIKGHGFEGYAEALRLLKAHVQGEGTAAK